MKAFDGPSNKLLSYFDLFDRRILFLCRMINTINIQNLSQENVSCLNTTLVVLMLANRKKQLPKYLKAIRQKSIEMSAQANSETSNGSHSLATMIINDIAQSVQQMSGSQLSMLSSSIQANSSNQGHSSSSQEATSASVELLKNFKDLLIFWQSHYLQKDKDCVGLEQNSRIEFSYWKSTVEMLLDAEVTSEYSLNYYLTVDWKHLRKISNNSLFFSLSQFSLSLSLSVSQNQ